MGEFAHGAQLQRSDGASPETFVPIAGVKSISGPNMVADIENVSDHDSPGAVKEFITTMLDPGEISIEGNWMPKDATQDWNTGANFLADLRDRTSSNYRLLIPHSTGDLFWYFTAFATSFEGALPFDSARTFTANFKITSEITEA